MNIRLSVSFWCVLMLANGPMAAQGTELARIKAEALHLDVAARMAEGKATPVDRTRLSLYIGSEAKSFILQSVTVRLDGGKPLRYEYSEVESEALLAGGLHAMAEQFGRRGTHHIEAQFVARKRGSTGSKRMVALLDEELHLPNAHAQVELLFSDSGFLNVFRGASVTLKYWEPVDPYLRSARFMAETGRPFNALSETLYALTLAPGLLPSAEVEQLISQSARAYGAEALPTALQRLSSASVAVLPEPTSDALYRRYNRGIELITEGQLAQGLSALETVASGDFSDEDKLMLRDKTNLALGYYYLSQRRNNDAADRFRNVRRLSPYANRALVGLGWAVLSPDNPALTGATRRGQQAEQAATRFLWSGSENDVAWSRRQAPFRHSWSIVTGEKEEDLRKALVPWMELIAGDAHDPAVQEGLLIIPYAMTHMGDFQQAEAYYRKASERLRDVYDTLHAAKQSITQGELADAITRNDNRADNGWDAWLCGVIAATPTAYASLLIANPDFLAALHGLRELHTIGNAMLLHWRRLASPAATDPGVAALHQRIGDVLTRIRAQQQPWQARFEAAALAELSERQKLVEMYLAEAGFALARIHDSPRPGSGALPVRAQP